MTHEIGLPQFGVELAAVCVTGYFVAKMWAQRAEPTARPLLAVAVVMFLGALGYPLTYHPNPLRESLMAHFWTGAGGPLWISVVMLIVILGGGFWFVFTLQYTGRGGRLVPLTSAGIAGFWLLLLVIALVGDFSPPPEVQAASNLEVTLSFGMFVMTILAFVGALLVLTTSLQRNAVRFREGITLAGGASLLAFAPSVADAVLHPSTTPVMLLLAAGLFVVAIGRYPTFEAPPAARISGRDRLIESMDDPFIVVDLDDRIRDLNAAGKAYFDIGSQDIMGAPLDTLLPDTFDPEEVAVDSDPVRVNTPTGNTLAITANRITDTRGRSFGHLLVCQDVTEQRRRERRLAVLNQLLTGAVIDRMQSVTEDAQSLRTKGERSSTGQTVAQFGATANARTTDLVGLVALTREVERALSSDEVGPVEIVPVLRNALEDIGSEGEVELTIEASEAVSAPTDPDVLAVLFHILLTDARDHSRDTVEVVVSETDNGPEIRFVEDLSPAERIGQADLSPERDIKREQRERVSELAPLVVQHIGGDISVNTTASGTRRTVVELPEPATTTADEQSAVSSEGLVAERSESESRGERQ